MKLWRWKPKIINAGSATIHGLTTPVTRTQFRVWSRTETRLWTINLFLGTCALYACRVALPICVAAMSQEYGWRKSDSGTIMSCFFWGYAMTQVIAGSIADLIGGENILPVSTLVWSLLTMLTPQLFDLAYWSLTPFGLIIFVRVFTGVGQGFHLPSMASIVSRHLTGSDKGRVFGISLAGSHVGTAAAGGIGSLLLMIFGWRSLFHFAALSSTESFGRRTRVLDVAAKLLIVEHDAHHESDVEEFVEDSADIADDYEPSFVSTTPSNGFNSCRKLSSDKVPSAAVPWSTLLTHSGFWSAATAQYCGANTYYTLFSWLPSYFADNFPKEKAFVYNVIPSLAIVVTSIAAPLVASRLLTHGHSITFTRRIMECISLVAMSFCLFVASLSSNYEISLGAFTIAMAARGLHHGGVAVNPHDFAPNHTGSVFGIFNAFSAITGFIGVYIAGLILQHTGNNWFWVFSFTAAQCVLGAIVYGLRGTGNKII